MLFPYLPWAVTDGISDTAGTAGTGGRQDLPAVRDRHREWTRRELTGRARAVAARLHALGVRRGDVIAVMLPNCTEFLAAMFGA
ncbi:MAG: AMP-binding protein, partial [Corynebacterium nuruki]|nr:AMP-binding protein [Corynebacterium nuruki]